MRLVILIWLRLRTVATTIFGRLWLRAEGIPFGDHLVLYGVPLVSRAVGSRIALGKNVVLISNSHYTALGVNHPVVLRTLRPEAEIVIGDDVGISGGSICAACKIVIGERCLLGANVTIADTDFHTIESEDRRYEGRFSKIHSAEVEIEDNVFVGANSIVLKGVHIGRNSVIGAGSVVTQDIPRDSIAAGVPCRVIRSLHEISDQGRVSDQSDVGPSDT